MTACITLQIQAKALAVGRCWCRVKAALRNPCGGNFFATGDFVPATVEFHMQMVESSSSSSFSAGHKRLTFCNLDRRSQWHATNLPRKYGQMGLTLLVIEYGPVLRFVRHEDGIGEECIEKVHTLPG